MSKIIWTDETWNPIVGCSHCSLGCNHCYAERMATRLAGMMRKDNKYMGSVTHGRWNGTVMGTYDLDKPKRWKRSRMVFVDSMGDLFHDNVPYNWNYKVVKAQETAPQHIYIWLTKRPGNMLKFINYYFLKEMDKNIWCGVTVCNQKEADEKIPVLLNIPAAVRFLSIEPMLGPIDLGVLHFRHTGAAGGHTEKPYIDWVIVGGESGPGARPMHPDWVRSIRDQCAAAGVHFLFKQWGEWGPWGDMSASNPASRLCIVKQGGSWEPLSIHGSQRVKYSISGGDAIMARFGKKRAGRMLNHKTHDGYPEKNINEN